MRRHDFPEEKIPPKPSLDSVHIVTPPKAIDTPPNTPPPPEDDSFPDLGQNNHEEDEEEKLPEHVEEKIKKLLLLCGYPESSVSDYQEIFRSINRKKIVLEDFESLRTLKEKLAIFVQDLGKKTYYKEIKSFTQSLLEEIQETIREYPRLLRAQEDAARQVILDEDKKQYYKAIATALGTWHPKVIGKVKDHSIDQETFLKNFPETFPYRPYEHKEEEEEDYFLTDAKDQCYKGVQDELNSLKGLYAKMTPERFVFALDGGFLMGDIYEFFKEKINAGTLTWRDVPSSLIEEVKKYGEEGSL